MKVINLSINKKVYTCNVYLVLGDWKRLDDVNTLVDVGRDSSIIDIINNIGTGIGKKKIEQVFLTHNHYDHVSLISVIKEMFNPVIYSFCSSLKGIDVIVKDGDKYKIGDRMFEIIYSPGHSQDSICLYCKEEKVLFAGDTPLLIQTVGGTYEEDFVDTLKKISYLDIKTIYPGHGESITENCNEKIEISLENVRKSLD